MSNYPRWSPNTAEKPWRKESKQASVSYEPKTEFTKLFQSLCHSGNPYSVWQDFILLTACSISNALDKRNFDKREELYLSIAKKYSAQQLNDFARMLAAVVLSLDRNPEQDFLGQLFMDLHLGNDVCGQFFTPYSVAALMSDITIGNLMDTVKEKGYVTVNDPTCGSGVMLIAAANKARKVLEKENLNFQNHTLLSGQDIDRTAALMAYIQLSLLGVAGYIKVGNSLTEPMSENDTDENYWYTPMYFSDIWQTRRLLGHLHKLTDDRE